MRSNLMLIFCILSFTVYAQKVSFENSYNLVITSDKGLTTSYSLNIVDDGTFTLNYLVQTDANKRGDIQYAKGTWKVIDKNVLQFDTIKIDEKYSLSLQAVRARYIKVNAQNTTATNGDTLVFDATAPDYLKGRSLIRNGYIY